SGADRMGIVRATALTASILAGAAVASGVSYFGFDAIWPQSEPKAASKPFTERARQTAEPQPDLPRKYALATIVDDAPPPPAPRRGTPAGPPTPRRRRPPPPPAPPDGDRPSVVEPPPPLFIEPPAPGAQSAEIEDDGVGDVTPTLEGRAKGGPGKRG